MSTAVSGIVLRLQATNRLLSSLRAKQAAADFVQSSSAQRQVVEAWLDGQQFSMRDVATMSEALVEVPFSADDLSALLALLSKAATVAKDAVPSAMVSIGRRQSQNYLAFDSYLPRTIWRVCVEHPSQAMASILQFLHTSLNLRLVHEPTFAKITGLVLMLELGYDGAMLESNNAIRQRYKDCKADFAKLRDSPVDCWIPTLPASPLVLLSDYPRVARRAYAAEAPVNCPFGEMNIQAVSRRVKMRGNDAPSHGPAAPSLDRCTSHVITELRSLVQGFRNNNPCPQITYLPPGNMESQFRFSRSDP